MSEPNPIIQWNEDRAFINIYNPILPRTLIACPAMYILYQAAIHAREIPGEVAEFGVYKGGSARLLSQLLPDKQVHLFDTFEGMPESDPSIDYHGPGHFADTTLESVQDFLEDRDNVEFHPGFFPDTTAEISEETRFALVHLDCDIYRSELDSLRYFYPRMNPGGIIVVDDYGWITCRGAKKAVDEFGAGHIYLPTGQALLIKGAS